MLRPNRWYTYTFSTFCAIFFAACQLKTPTADLPTFNIPGYGAVFKGDTGFIIKRTALPYLLSAKLIDTSIADWAYTADHDTIGKYYHLNKDSGYLACILTYNKDGDEHLLLFEIDPDGCVKKTFQYYYGVSHCCWSAAFDGFGRLGNYFFIRACATSAAFCGSDLYLFKTAQSQDYQYPILEWNWVGSDAADPRMHQVFSVVAVKGDSVTVYYKVMAGVEAVLVDSFDVKYRMVDNRWVANDSSGLKKYQ
ncbi:hypothetical protein [Chitinophaga sp.]|uniref:hypothetical protein n=1 Tax=Chitinophaga sp. TaxID=1869181 RepID=UPI002F954256